MINLYECTALTIDDNASFVNLDRAKPTNGIKYTLNLQTSCHQILDSLVLLIKPEVPCDRAQAQ